MLSVVSAPPTLFAVLAFNASNQLAVRRLGSKLGVAFSGSDLAMATSRLESSFATHTAPAEFFSCTVGERNYRAFFVQISGASFDWEIALYYFVALAAV